jgi:hypothetical protein
MCVFEYGYLCGQRQWTEKLICMENFKGLVCTFLRGWCVGCAKKIIYNFFDTHIFKSGGEV